MEHSGTMTVHYRLVIGRRGDKTTLNLHSNWIRTTIMMMMVMAVVVVNN